MEKRLNTKFDLYIKNFKDGIRDKMSQLQMASGDAADLMEYIYEYDRLVLEKEDFIKRKRVKNSIPENNKVHIWTASAISIPVFVISLIGFNETTAQRLKSSKQSRSESL